MVIMESPQKYTEKDTTNGLNVAVKTSFLEVWPSRLPRNEGKKKNFLRNSSSEMNMTSEAAKITSAVNFNSVINMDLESDIMEEEKSSENSGNEPQNNRAPRKRTGEPHEDLQGNSKRRKVVYDNNGQCQTDMENEDIGLKQDMFYNKDGLVNSLHGDIYQLKIQMLFLKGALDKDYDFQLGTEVKDAEKFDDVVFKYKRKDERGNFEIIFVQAKHRLSSHKITTSDLLTVKNDDAYNLQKYFISFRKIKQHLEYSKTKLAFILFTNIDFDYKDLKEKSIETENAEMVEIDAIINVSNSKINAKHIKLKVSEGHDHEIYKTLRETSDVYILANELARLIHKKRSFELNGQFKYYHYRYALSKTVFDIKKTETQIKKTKTQIKKNKTQIKKTNTQNTHKQQTQSKIVFHATFQDKFLNGKSLSDEVLNFRKVLQSSLARYEKEICQIKLPVSENFAYATELNLNPIIDNSKDLAEKIADIVIKAQDNDITIRRTPIIDSNINKLAYHILVEDEPENDQVKFSKMFFDENVILPGNLCQFRSDLKSELKKSNKDLSILSQFKFRITKFYTCPETPQGDLIHPNTGLPNDRVEDAEIEDFLNKLVFAVNQPDEVQLGNIIKKKLGRDSHFNLLNADLVSDSFQTKMLDWFKEKRQEKGKEGVWLNAASGQHFIRSIEEKIGILISMGISVAYPDELATYAIRFDENKIHAEIKAFLSQDNVSENILCIINLNNDTLLSALNVYSALEILKQQKKYAQYQKNDSYIFMRLKTLMGEKTQQYVIRAFTSPDSFSLLILDCECTEAQNIEGLCSKLSDILIETNKKVILMTTKPKQIINFFDMDLKSRDIVDGSSFSDFTDESKNILLQKEVIFQGRREKVRLKQLIDQSDEKAKDIIDAGKIVELLTNEKISIGNELKINEYYIRRKFKSVAFRKEEIQKYLMKDSNTEQKDLFVVTGDTSGLQHDNVYVFDNSQSADEKFDELLSENCDSNIHRLESGSKFFIWLKSHGSILNLIPYRIKEAVDTSCPYLKEESELIYEDIRDKIAIISGTAGIGKSTVLTNLSMGLLNDQSLWVIRINLNDHSRKLEIKSNGTFKSVRESVDDVINFLLNDLLVLANCDKFDKELFINNLKHHGNIAFLIDGYDEICPDDADVVIDLLRSLRKLKVKKIFVTTRTNFRQELEEAFDIFASILEPFSIEEQTEFLVQFWTKGIVLTNLNTNKLRIYAESIRKNVCKCIDNNEKEFISNPLHLKMVAEIFQDAKAVGVAIDSDNTTQWQSCKEFLESDLIVPIIPTNLSLVKLYEHFAEKKYFDLYLEGKGIINTSKVPRRKGKAVSNAAYAEFKTNNGLLALKLLFNEEELNELLFPYEMTKLEDVIQNFHKGNHMEGIVDLIIDGKPYFTHRTYAEYFASILIAEKILARPSDTLQCINKTMLNMSPIFMHSIIYKLEGEHETLTLKLEKPLLHYILTDSCSNFLKLLLQCNYSDWQRKLDASGKTPLHYAVGNRQTDIIEKLLKYADDIRTENILEHGSFKYPEYENSVLVKFVNMKDNDGMTALYYSVQNNYFDVAFKLLSKGACISLLTEDNVNELIRHMYSMFYDGVNEKYIILSTIRDKLIYHPIQEKLILKAPGFFNDVIESDQSEILSYFFKHGRVQVIDTLLDNINDSNRKIILTGTDWWSKNSLENVLFSNELSDESCLEITKCLFKHSNGFSLLSVEPPPMKQVILHSAIKGHVQTLNYFINLQEQTDFYSIVYIACKYGQIKTVKYMYENHKDHIVDLNGNTGLHAACYVYYNTVQDNTTYRGYRSAGKTVQSYGFRLENIIKYLIDNGDIYAKNKCGQTPLDLAKSFTAQRNVIEHLISGATINCEARRSNTAFSNDIACNKDNGAKNLCTSEKEPQSDKQSVSNPRLHSAIMLKEFEKAIKVIQQGADVNEKNDNGDAPLHLCLMEYCENVQDVVMMLLQYGAIYDIRDKSERTPYDLIPVEMHGSTVFWVLTTLKKLFCSQNLARDLKDAMTSTQHSDCNDENVNREPVLNLNYTIIRNLITGMLTSRNSQRETLLHITADTNDEKFSSILLDVNHHNIEEQRRFKYYIHETPYLPDLCYQPTSVDSTDYGGNAPIHIAASKGHKTVAFRLLEYGIKFNSTNSNGDTPEVLAIRNSHTSIVEVLQAIKKLFVAIEESNTFEIEKYIEAMIAKEYKNPFINVKNQFGKSPLHLAVSLNQLGQQEVKLLLDNGANVKTIDDIGNTPLHSAVLNDNINNVKLLTNYGAIYDAKNNNCDEPLKLARGKSYDLLKLIDTSFKNIKGVEPQKAVANLENIDKDDLAAIVHSCDHKGNTLLHYAVYAGDFMIVERLLGNGAMYNARDVYGIPFVNKDVKDLLTMINRMFENLDNIYEGVKKVNIKVIQNVLDGNRKTLLDYAKEISESKIISLLND